MKHRKMIGLIGAIALIAAACSSAGSTDATDGGAASGDPVVSTTSADSSTTTAASAVGAGALPEGPSALDDRFDDAFPDPLIDPGDVLSGGPPPDGIPPIDDPKFISVQDADAWLNDVEPVLVVDVNGDVRVYPIQIMIWHEIVNDTVGGVPLAVTYCPLCNSAISFSRTVRGVETTFGTSGSLYFANLVMYDRATESLWNQLDGRAVIGVLTGDVLEQVPSSTVSWGDLKESRPDAKVLDRDATGYRRGYGTNPYTGLDDPNGQPFLFNGDVDVRAKAMQNIVAMESESDAVAWSLDAISDDSGISVTEGEFAGDPIVIFWKSGEASALDTSDIAEGRDVGTVGVFSPTVDGRELTFTTEGDTFIDDETSSEWNVFGEAVSGPLSGTTLEPVVFVRTFWFSWAAFRPDTDLVEAP
ncbi:MAG: DUF3179 domain-containing protein [Actinomycetia bacterium]|nr:DUF3179 domain-containing protein [Actinomycetes bacterium]